MNDRQSRNLKNGELPKLLTSEEAADVLAISDRKLWSLQASGEIPHVRIGRAVRFDVADLLAWIEANKQGGAR